MPSPAANPTPITPPRVPFIDARTGLIDRAWYMFFLSLFNAAQSNVDNPDLGPSAESLIASYDEALRALAQLAETQPSSETSELQQQLELLRQEVQTQRQPELGSMAPLEQDNVPWLTFNNAPSPVPTAVGSMYWDGGTTMGIQATANVLIRIGEAEYVYAKASSAITKGQLCYHTGSVGSSGVITAAPTPLALTDPNQIVGVAAESIALNDFGLIQISGTLRGFNTTGSSVGEVWADGDPLYYNPSFVGSFTKTKPSAPNQKTYLGEVINAGSGASGSISIRISPGSVLGGTDSNVQFGTVNNGDLIQYDSVLQYWKNVAPSSISIGTATNLAGGLAGSVPYQTAPGTTTFLNIGTALQVLKVNAGATAPEWVSGAALTKVDDTNVTLTLGGTPATSLLAATSLTLGWTGQLGLTRGGTNASLTASAGSVVYSTASALALNTAGSTGNWLRSAGTAAPVWTAPAALTRVNDTNVTLTLGGSASTALLNAASITAGWTGQLAVSRGGTGASTQSGARTNLGATTVGSNFFTLTNPSAITFPRINADNTVSTLDAATFRAAIGAGTGNGTVTSVAALTLGTTGTDLSSTVANGTTTPVITLNVPTASATNRGALSSTDWSTFNAKQPVAAPVTQTANFSVGASDVWSINNKSGSSCTVTLPTASSNTGRVLYFLNYQAQTLVSASSNVVPLAGGAATTAILEAVAGANATLVSDGTNWIMTQYDSNNALQLE